MQNGQMPVSSLWMLLENKQNGQILVFLSLLLYKLKDNGCIACVSISLNILIFPSCSDWKIRCIFLFLLHYYSRLLSQHVVLFVCFHFHPSSAPFHILACGLNGNHSPKTPVSEHFNPSCGAIQDYNRTLPLPPWISTRLIRLPW